MQIEVHGRRMKLKRELRPGGSSGWSCRCLRCSRFSPASTKPRYASLKGIMAAKKKEIATVTRESLGVADAPTQHIERIYVPQKTKKTEFITGRPRKLPPS